MGYKYLIKLLVISILWVLVGCSEKNNKAEDSHSVTVNYGSFYTNTEEFSYNFSLNELNSILDSKGISDKYLNVSNAVFTTSNGKVTISKPKGKDYVTLEFSNGKKEMHESNGYTTMIIEYPLTITFSNIPVDELKEDVLITSNTNEIRVLDYYRGEIIKAYSTEASREEIINSIFTMLYESKNKVLDIDEISKNLISFSGENDEVIAKKAYQYMLDNFQYDKATANQVASGIYDNDTRNFKGLKEFSESKKGICYQFAYMYKMILDTHDIENRLVFGNLRGLKNYTNHVWNEVLIDGKWVPVDTTGNGFGAEGSYGNYIATYRKNL